MSQQTPEEFEEEIVRLLGNAEILRRKDTPNSRLEYEEHLDKVYRIIEEEYGELYAEQAIEMVEDGKLENAYQFLEV